jgi:hypothetical protein
MRARAQQLDQIASRFDRRAEVSSGHIATA